MYVMFLRGEVFHVLVALLQKLISERVLMISEHFPEEISQLNKGQLCQLRSAAVPHSRLNRRDRGRLGGQDFHNAKLAHESSHPPPRGKRTRHGQLGLAQFQAKPQAKQGHAEYADSDTLIN